MNFINKEYVLTVEVGDDGRQISYTLDSRARSNPKVNTHLNGHDIGQGSLTQARRAVEQQMVQSLASSLSGGDSNVQIIFDLRLSVEVLKASWPQAGIERCVFNVRLTRYDASYLTLISSSFGAIIPHPLQSQDKSAPKRVTLAVNA